MRKLVWLPLEPLEQRYTNNWKVWYPRAFEENDVDYITVNGDKLTDQINVGSVLDAYGTNYWKFSQLANLIRLMQNGEVLSTDVLLVADLWYPGIEALQYIKCLGGIRPLITGILHAGTYDSNDFTYSSGMRPWGHLLEESWLQFFDLVFTATQYHKDLILKSHNVNPDKINVTGLPFYLDTMVSSRQYIVKDDRLVVFPHRLDPEKRPQDFDGVVKGLDCRIVRTGEQLRVPGYKKDKYYDTLAEASIAVSTARQETFGYAMLEATTLGCIPLVPNEVSYAEMYPRYLKYDTLTELREKLVDILSNKDRLRDYQRIARSVSDGFVSRYGGSISRMLQEITNYTEGCRQ